MICIPADRAKSFARQQGQPKIYAPGIFIYKLARSWFPSVEDVKPAKSISLMEMYGEEFQQKSLSSWIEGESVSLVSQMTAQNFHTYEALGLPMVIFFLDVEAGFSSSTEVRRVSNAKIAWGKQYALINQHSKRSQKYDEGESLLRIIHSMNERSRRAIGNGHALQLLEDIATKYRGTLTFVYVDGRQYSDHLRTLGIQGGVDALPAAAMNTKDGAQYPLRAPLSQVSIQK